MLVYGPAGARKTALISKLARDSGNQECAFRGSDFLSRYQFMKILIGKTGCPELDTIVENNFKMSSFY